MQETFLDRVFRRLRKPLILLALISGPVTIWSYGYGFFLLKDVVGLPVWLFLALCNIIVLIGFGCLVDSRQEQRTILPPER